MATDMYKDVGDFHDKFGLQAFIVSGNFPWDQSLVDFRIKCLREELKEFEDGASKRDHAEMFDALIDLVYFAVGTAHLMGYPWKRGWQIVQEANMTKVRGKKDGSDSKRGSGWDVVKPEGWTPPDIKRLLKSYGFDVPEADQAPIVDGCPTCRRTWSDIDHVRKKTAISGYRYTAKDGAVYCSKLCSGDV